VGLTAVHLHVCLDQEILKLRSDNCIKDFIKKEQLTMECGCQGKQKKETPQGMRRKVEQSRRTSNSSTTHQQMKNERLVSRLEYAERLRICQGCEKVKSLLGRMICGECGCLLELKATMSSMKCPLGKWAH
jgi:hypothetical protein